MTSLLDADEPAHEVLSCDEHYERVVIGEPYRATLTVYRRDTIFLRGEHYWESRCTRSDPSAGFHNQALAYAAQHEELYLYRVQNEDTGYVIKWQGICGRCLTGTEHSDQFTLMDLYLDHTCSPG